MTRKSIVLAVGTGGGQNPLMLAASKQLLPVHDRTLSCCLPAPSESGVAA